MSSNAVKEDVNRDVATIITHNKPTMNSNAVKEEVTDGEYLLLIEFVHRHLGFHDAELEYIILRVNASLMKDCDIRFVYKELLNIVH